MNGLRASGPCRSWPGLLPGEPAVRPTPAGTSRHGGRSRGPPGCPACRSQQVVAGRAERPRRSPAIPPPVLPPGGILPARWPRRSIPSRTGRRKLALPPSMTDGLAFARIWRCSASRSSRQSCQPGTGIGTAPRASRGCRSGPPNCPFPCCRRHRAPLVVPAARARNG